MFLENYKKDEDEDILEDLLEEDSNDQFSEL